MQPTTPILKQVNPTKTEIRMAFATSGAIALVVYEAGVAHEIDRFVRAWRQLDSPELKAWQAVWQSVSAAGVQVEPVIDVLTGASAGGIASLLLGHCLINQVPMADFKPVWIQGIDARNLRWSDFAVPDALLDLGSVADWIRNRMQSDAKRARPRSDLELEVKVCVTDHFGHRVKTANALGGTIQIDSKATVLRFEAAHFDLKAKDAARHIEETIAAARATSAFPFLFSPTQIGDKWYLDGGIWNNQPIDLALEAIKNKPAYHRTHRILMFVEPDPLGDEPVARNLPKPSAIQTSLSLPFFGVKGSIEPALSGLVDTNRRLGLYRRLIDDVEQSDEVSLYGYRLLCSSQSQLEQLHRAEAQDDSIRPTTLNLTRVNSALMGSDAKRIARWHQAMRNRPDSVTDKAWHRALILLKKIEWADLWVRQIRHTIQELNNDLFQGNIKSAEASAEVFEDKESLYASLDYFNWQLPTLCEYVRGLPERTAYAERLDAVLDALADADEGQIDEALNAWNLDAFESNPEAPRSGLPFECPPDGDLCDDQVREWLQANGRKRIGIEAVRYVVSAISDLEGRQDIDLIRISPDDADNTDLVGGKAPGVSNTNFKLAGEGLGHVQGFLQTRWRLNDYTWGRLDAIDGLLSVLRKVLRDLNVGGWDPTPLRTALQHDVLSSAVDDGRHIGVVDRATEVPEVVPPHLARQVIGYGTETPAQADEPETSDNLRHWLATVLQMLRADDTKSLKPLLLGLRGTATLAVLFGGILPLRLRKSGSLWLTLIVVLVLVAAGLGYGYILGAQEPSVAQIAMLVVALIVAIAVGGMAGKRGWLLSLIVSFSLLVVGVYLGHGPAGDRLAAILNLDTGKMPALARPEIQPSRQSFSGGTGGDIESFTRESSPPESEKKLGAESEDRRAARIGPWTQIVIVVFSAFLVFAASSMFWDYLRKIRRSRLWKMGG